MSRKITLPPPERFTAKQSKSWLKKVRTQYGRDVASDCARQVKALTTLGQSMQILVAAIRAHAKPFRPSLALTAGFNSRPAKSTFTAANRRLP